MDAWDLWRLCDSLKVKDAADLLVGMLPDEVEAMAYTGGELTPSNRRKYVTQLRAATSALHAAIEGGRLPATLPNSLFGPVHPDLVGEIEEEDDTPDLNEAVVRVNDLKKWLKEKGVRSGFFFPEEAEIAEPDYLDPNHPRYSPKLAAAIRAWQAVEDPGKKTPKQALVTWLRKNAAQFDLTDDEGNLNQLGIKEVAKVANWQPEGGAPTSSL